MRCGKIFIFVLCFFLWAQASRATVFASDTAWTEETAVNEDETLGKMVDEMIGDEKGFGQVQEILNSELEENGFDIRETIYTLIQGEDALDISHLLEQVKKCIYQQVTGNVWLWKQCFVLAVFSAVFAKIGSSFENQFMAQTGTYIGYLFMFSIFLSTFSSLFSSAQNALDAILNFMKALFPIYFMTTGAAVGQAMATGGYQVALLVISGAELIMGNILLPMVEVYFFMVLLNHLTEEHMLEGILEILETAIKWGIKIVLGCVIGLNAIQGLLLPAISNVKNHALLQAGESIPVVGQTMLGVTEMVMGMCGLIRNAVGAAGIFGALLVGLYPVVKIGIVALVLKLESAMMRPMGETQISECMGQVAKSAALLCYVLLVTVLLFVLTLLLLSYSLRV